MTNGTDIRSRNLTLLFAAAFFSRLASRVVSLALILYAIDTYASSVVAGLIVFFAFAPGLLASPFTGVILDQYGEKAAVTIDFVVNAALIGAIALLHSMDILSQEFLIALVAVYSVSSPLGMAGVRRLIPRLVPSSSLDRANAIDTVVYTAVDVIGPALLGILLYFTGYVYIFVMTMGFYIVAVCFVLPIRYHATVEILIGNFLQKALEGVRIVARHPTLRGLAASYTLYQVTWGIVVIAVPVYVKGIVSAENADLATGMLFALVGVAGGVGALVTAYLRTDGRERLFMLVGIALTAAAAWPLMGSLGTAGLVAGLMLAGFLVGPVDVALLSLRQRRTDPAILGRVLSVSISLNLAGYPVGAAIGGWLVALSPVYAFGAGAFFSILACFFTGSIPAGSPDTKNGLSDAEPA